MKKVKGSWVACLLVAGVVGAGVSNVQSSVQAAASETVDTVDAEKLASFDTKDALANDDKIKAEVEATLARVTGEAVEKTVDQVKEEIKRQEEAGLPAYVVQEGDTLALLAEATDQDADELAGLNGMKTDDELIIGDILTGVVSEQAEAVVVKESANGNQVVAKIQTVTPQSQVTSTEKANHEKVDKNENKETRHSASASQEVAKSEPSKPAEPSQPTEPTKPAEPTQPTEPTQPAEPTQPTEPTKPAEPSQPTEPTKPAEPTQPTEPTKPAEPTQPTEPTQPVEPVQPTEPTQPVEPTQPTEPTQPVEPTQPTEPTQPSNPEVTKPETKPEETKPETKPEIKDPEEKAKTNPVSLFAKQVEEAVFKLINDFRTVNGQSELKYNAQLTDASRFNSKNLADKKAFAHTWDEDQVIKSGYYGPNGEFKPLDKKYSSTERMPALALANLSWLTKYEHKPTSAQKGTDFDYVTSLGVENIANEIMYGLFADVNQNTHNPKQGKNYRGHRQTLLDSRWEDVGVGLYIKSSEDPEDKEYLVHDIYAVQYFGTPEVDPSIDRKFVKKEELDSAKVPNKNVYDEFLNEEEKLINGSLEELNKSLEKTDLTEDAKQKIENKITINKDALKDVEVLRSQQEAAYASEATNQNQ
ncbi:LysM peptidoglycan-binding domain-containing protein [Hutsoniella sourekii]